jgi:hypothetical protein
MYDNSSGRWFAAIQDISPFISANDCPTIVKGNFQGHNILSVKNDLTSALGTPRFWQSRINASEFSVHPAHILDSLVSNLYMVSIGSGATILL